MKMRNFVQKYLKKFCKSKVEKDRKKEFKKGLLKDSIQLRSFHIFI